MRTLKHFPQLLALILSDVDWIAPVAATVLTSMWRQACASLTFWNLAEAGFTLLAESLHTFSATSILDDKAIELLSEAVFLNTSIVNRSI